MDSAEFGDWIAYDSLDPIGRWRDDFHAALIASTILNTTRTKKSDKVYVAKDFMPQWDKQPETPEQRIKRMQHNAMALAAYYGRKTT
jgi:hypothetical protein